MSGLYFEEFEVGRVFKHAITRTITETDNLIFCALTSSSPCANPPNCPASSWSIALAARYY